MISFGAVFALLCAANVIAARESLDCVETAKRFGSVNFISALYESNLTDAVRNIGSAIIFVPTNDAFLNLGERFRQQFENNITTYQQTILNHVVNGTPIAYDKLFDEQMLVTLAWNASVRVNLYNTSTTDAFKTINGARINTTRDVYCNNNTVVLHFVNQLITSISTEKILPILQRNSSFSQFFRVYNNATAAGKALLTPPSAVTLFIPDNDAIKRMNQEFFESIVNSYALADEFLGIHVVDSEAYFSQSLWDKQSVKSHNGTQLNFSYDSKQDKYLINGIAGFVDKDIAGLDGVYHIIDNSLFVKNNRMAATTNTAEDDAFPAVLTL